MNFFRRKKENSLKAFANGTIIPLENVHDNMFSAKLMGEGIAIESSDGKYYSPADGVVTMVFPTKHALGIKTNKGLELLLHVGIDTVNLKGEGFVSHVDVGQKVSSGDLLLEADLQLIKEKGYNTESILCICEPKDLHLSFTDLKTVKAKEDTIITIES